MPKVAVVLVRGTIRASKAILDTLHMLRLRKKNACVMLENSASTLGMITKVKDYVTWGEVSDEVAGAVASRAREGVAHMSPPRKGFGRKGVKKAFSSGGALGYRGEKMDDLIKRMM